MSKHSSERSTIPSVLSIPEKLSDFLDRLLKLRFPLERQFSGRDILLLVSAAVLLTISVLVRPLQRFRLPVVVLAMLLAAIPLCLQGFRSIRKRKVPLEEGSLLLAALTAFLSGEHSSGPMILIFSGLLCQAEAYCLLHRDAAPDYLAESLLSLRHSVETADEEKSPERRVLASGSLAFFMIFLVIAFVFALCTLFHPDEYAVWLHRSVIFLILASPSALLFSSILTHFGAVFSAAKADIQFGRDSIPEQFSRCKLFAFSKTGTVTDGRFIISEIAPVGLSEDELLRIAAVAECTSDHPIAMALKAAAGLREGAVPAGVMDVKEIPGKGIATFVSGHQVYVGNAGLLEDHGIWYQIPAKGGSAVHVAVDSTYRGYIMMTDTLRDNAFEALEELRALGASTLVMLTGDVRSSARALAASLNFDMVKPELNPEEKGSAIRYLRSAHGEKARIACVGDGYHDTEMFREADISVCLEPQSDGVHADINIFSNDITRIPLALRISRRTELTLLIHAAGIAGLKIFLAVLGAVSVLRSGVIAGLDCAFGIAAVIHALTCLTLEKRKG